MRIERQTSPTGVIATMDASDLRSIPGMIEHPAQGPRLRILVALASYGTSNNDHLERLIHEYRAMAFDVDVVILSNIDKRPAPDIECRVGLPSKNPWSLPFAHKPIFAERVAQYDLFIYSEDDILITERQIRAFLAVTEVLKDDEVAGFVRMEKSTDGAVSYPDMHDEFHWDTGSLRSRSDYVLASFTNEHAACYLLTQAQLKRAIRSGGFLVEPYQWKHDLLCTAATDPYIRCGFTKLIPISHFGDFTVHHLSNKYAGKFGVSEAEMLSQVGALRALAAEPQSPAALLDPETKLWRRMFSKEYYERVDENVLNAIPRGTRKVLSIGCGSGALEALLVQRGIEVVAVPLDAVIGKSAATRGIEMVHGDFGSAARMLGDRTFDCVLFLNMLHLVPDPVSVMSLFRGAMHAQAVMIIQSPNMRSIPEIWRRLRYRYRYRGFGSFGRSGVHVTGIGDVEDWCSRSGLTVGRTIGLPHKRFRFLRGRAPFVEFMMSPQFISVATKSGAFARG